MPDALIFDGLRTPFGRHAGALAPVRPDDLLGGVIARLLERHPSAARAIEDVVAGCANQAGEDARNVARHALLLAGLPESVGGQTVNRLCGSGLAAVADAARAVRCGEGELFVAGGVESMSRAPFVMAKATSAYSRQMPMFDSTIGARFPNPSIEENFGADTMPETADNIAKGLSVPRDDSDRFALGSQQKYEAARAAGFFTEEIAPVEIASARGKPPAIVSADEHPRPQTTLESLQKLKPLFEGGVVTAGNASGINDGAAALLIGSAAAGDRLGLESARTRRIGGHRGRRASRDGPGARARQQESAGARGPHARGNRRHRNQRGVRDAGAGMPRRTRPRQRRFPGQSQRRRHRGGPSSRRLRRAARIDGVAPVGADRRDAMRSSRCASGWGRASRW